jgi:hypothetical protein
MPRDPFERIIANSTSGIYESNYLKANSPDGRYGLWIKHNILRPQIGEGIAEFWFILSSPDAPPTVAKREVPLTQLSLDPTAIRIRSDDVALSSTEAAGGIADCRWQLRLSGGDAPLFHFPWDWMYTAGFPKKKAITPAPHLQFNGQISVGALEIDVEGWEGIRGHNWGREHAWSYAYGNCQRWDDGERRCIDGFSAKIKLPGGGHSPWLSTIVARQPEVNLNRPTDWFGGAEVNPTSWHLHRRRASLEMQVPAHQMVGLRYGHPDGKESYCYNTKFASVRWAVGTTTYTSTMGELEVLTPTPVADIPLHPGPRWSQSQGDYRG